MKSLDVRPAKDEINATVQSMMIGVYIVGALIVGGYLLMVRNDSVEIMRTLLTCGISLAFLAAQGDHRIFRLGAWVRQVETNPDCASPWETHKAQLWSRVIVMPVVDFGMSIAPLYVTCNVAWRLWQADQQFVIVALPVLAFGMFMIWAGQKLANW